MTTFEKAQTILHQKFKFLLRGLGKVYVYTFIYISLIDLS